MAEKVGSVSLLIMYIRIMVDRILGCDQCPKDVKHDFRRIKRILDGIICDDVAGCYEECKQTTAANQRPQ